MSLRCGNQHVQPAGLRKRVRVQEGDEIAIIQAIDGTIVRNRESEILAMTSQRRQRYLDLVG